MQKTILVTGSTDGIGSETARMLVSLLNLFAWIKMKDAQR